MTEKGATIVVSYPLGSPSLSPRAGCRRHIGPTQIILFLLVSGMLIEAGFIYRLYNPPSAPTESEQPSGTKIIRDAPTKWPRLIEAPSKPLAHLTDGSDVKILDKHIMFWSELADPLLYKVNYKDGRLVFQENGYYYVYSKVTFNIETFVNHSVELKTKYYLSKKSITLLKSVQTSFSKHSNSFLAGVFHFYKDDAIYVKVSDTSHVSHHDSSENVFGAYMI
ncbi:hypothetical protein WMY93_002511 [Mugilogobius chulae]|uniref:THD domain-containing protein n=1 Tax=Mugilogobius chulae TaxID=88201 RepID=A0AAW0Q2C7_9GOBI